MLNSGSMQRRRRRLWVSWLVLVFAGLVVPHSAQAAEKADDTVLGLRLRLGWKYDDVRLCGATGPGAGHGPDIDIAAFVEIPLGDNNSIDINLPIFRPLVFALMGDMIQFEPEAALLVRRGGAEPHLVFGPSLGVSLHYGPDNNSESEGKGRTASFWAIGPRVGAYVGLDFVRPDDGFNFQLGLHPYVTPLVAIHDSHSGWVAGVTLDNSFRFRANP